MSATKCRKLAVNRLQDLFSLEFFSLDKLIVVLPDINVNFTEEKVFIATA